MRMEGSGDYYAEQPPENQTVEPTGFLAGATEHGDTAATSVSEQLLAPDTSSALNAQPAVYDPFKEYHTPEDFFFADAPQQYAPEQLPFQDRPGLILPENITELLETALVPSGLPGRETEKFYVRGHPELLVRYNARNPREETQQAHVLLQQMAKPEYGINVLPAQLEPCGDRLYVVTARVEGHSVAALLTGQNPDPQLAGMVDEHMAKLGHWLRSEVEAGHCVLGDVWNTGQWMYGTTHIQPNPTVWLTDLPTVIFGDYDYAFNVAAFANGILEAEEQAGVRMEQARVSLEQAMDLMPQISREPDRAAELINTALRTKKFIDFDDVGNIK